MPAVVCATCFYSMPLGYDLNDERYVHPLVCRKATTHPEERFPLIWPFVESTFTCENYVPKENVAMYIDRGDPNDFDYDELDLTKDDAWHELDLSAIVPEGAKAVHLYCRMRNQVTQKSLRFREHGNTSTYNVSTLYSQVANQYNTADMATAIDNNRKIDYYASTVGWVMFEIVVKGWWL